MTDSTGDRPARSGRRRIRTIAWTLLFLSVGPGLGIALIVGSVIEHGAVARTSYTQAHGVRRAARVVSEDAGSGKNPTSALTVRLSGPVEGHDTTTVHIQGAPAYSPGAPVTVVVDPQDPGYAELPGAPYASSAQWVAPLVIGLASIVIIPSLTGITVLRRLRSRRRLHQSLLH